MGGSPQGKQEENTLHMYKMKEQSGKMGLAVVSSGGSAHFSLAAKRLCKALGGLQHHQEACSPALALSLHLSWRLQSLLCVQREPAAYSRARFCAFYSMLHGRIALLYASAATGQVSAQMSEEWDQQTLLGTAGYLPNDSKQLCMSCRAARLSSYQCLSPNAYSN